MWMYPRSSGPNRSFSEELDDMEINSQIHKVLPYGAILNLGTGPVPLREGVNCNWETPLGPTFSYMCQFWFLNVCVFLHRVSGVLTAPHGGSPYLRMWRVGWPTVPTTNGYKYGGKGDGPGAPPGRRLGRGGRTLPSSLEGDSRTKWQD
jgi:hypothetical protein